MIYKQKRQPNSTLAWRVDGTRAHGALVASVAEVAVRLFVLAIQSADVERVCKAHKVIHTKVRNRHRSKLVHTYLFTYVNLRLIRKIKTELGVSSCKPSKASSASPRAANMTAQTKRRRTSPRKTRASRRRLLGLSRFAEMRAKATPTAGLKEE